jgi:hypothetical protein
MVTTMNKRSIAATISAAVAALMFWRRNPTTKP